MLAKWVHILVEHLGITSLKVSFFWIYGCMTRWFKNGIQYIFFHKVQRGWVKIWLSNMDIELSQLKYFNSFSWKKWVNKVGGFLQNYEVWWKWCNVWYYITIFIHPTEYVRVIYIQAEFFLCRSRNISSRKSFPVTASPQDDVIYGTVWVQFCLHWFQANLDMQELFLQEEEGRSKE